MHKDTGVAVMCRSSRLGSPEKRAGNHCIIISSSYSNYGVLLLWVWSKAPLLLLCSLLGTSCLLLCWGLSDETRHGSFLPCCTSRSLLNLRPMGQSLTSRSLLNLRPMGQSLKAHKHAISFNFDVLQTRLR